MHTSEETAALFEALAKSQSAIKNPAKNREVTVKLRDNAGSYKFKYATFDGIIDAIREPLTANGLWFTQSIDDGAMTTRITHSSGQWIDSVVPMPGLNGKPQDIGSLITYFKRYSLSAALGIAVDEDDDANGAQGNEVEFTPRSDRRRPSAQQDRFAGGPVQGFDDQPRKPGRPPALKGPLKTRKEAFARYGEIVRELHACGDEETLDVFLYSIQAELDQFRDELPTAWNGDGADFIGMEAEIANVRKELAA